MKRSIIFLMFIALLGAPLFGQFSVGLQFDAGVNGLIIGSGLIESLGAGTYVIDEAYADIAPSEGGDEEYYEDYVYEDAYGYTIGGGIIIPILDFNLSLLFGGGPFRIGAGIRSLSLVMASVAWPNIYAELDIGRSVTAIAQFGGYAFGILVPGTVSTFITMPYFVPDLSVWFNFRTARLGTWRLGAGAVTIVGEDDFTNFSDEFWSRIIFYAGVKVSLPLGNWGKQQEAAAPAEPQPPPFYW
jgi:hypothetical protein